jgi:diguanylate cyclase (GGDEF)-like protein
LARRLLNKVRKTKIQIYDSLLEAKLTLSIGLASFPADANNKEDLIIKADQNLLQAKKDGKDRYSPSSF